MRRIVLEGPLFEQYFQKVEVTNFEVASDAFSTFKVSALPINVYIKYMLLLYAYIHSMYYKHHSRKRSSGKFGICTFGRILREFTNPHAKDGNEKQQLRV